MVTVKGDSQLVIKQLTGEYNCLNNKMIYYFDIVLTFARKFDDISFQYVPRLGNEIANDLAQLSSGYKVSVNSLISLCKVRQRIPLCKMDVYNTYANIDDWRKPIIDYLNNPDQPVDRKIRLRALKFTSCGGKLFRRSTDGTLLRCLGEMSLD